MLVSLVVCDFICICGFAFRDLFALIVEMLL